MKLKLVMLGLGLVSLTACKKDLECECQTVYYNNEGVYQGSTTQEHLVRSQSECASFNVQSALEVTNCVIDSE
jgi:hypothetical protein